MQLLAFDEQQKQRRWHVQTNVKLRLVRHMSHHAYFEIFHHLLALLLQSE